MIHRHATAVWKGGLKEGTGNITTESAVLDATPYSFARRFEGEAGTNPEELIAAAHAGCFSMAFSAQLGQAGHTPERIETRAVVSLERGPEGFVIPEIALDVQAKIPGIDEALFHRLATQAKETCPISRLMNAKISMTAKLE